MTLDKELYVEALKCSEIIELLSDAQLFKTMFNVGYCYPKLVKGFVIKLPIRSPFLNF